MLLLFFNLLQFFFLLLFYFILFSLFLLYLLFISFHFLFYFYSLSFLLFFFYLLFCYYLLIYSPSPLSSPLLPSESATSSLFSSTKVTFSFLFSSYILFPSHSFFFLPHYSHFPSSFIPSISFSSSPLSFYSSLFFLFFSSKGRNILMLCCVPIIRSICGCCFHSARHQHTRYIIF